MSLIATLRFVALLCALVVGAPARAAPDVETVLSRLISLGQYDTAREILAARAPSDLDVLFLEARILKAQGDLEAAIAQFRRILDADPQHLNALRELAHSYLLNTDYRNAKALFEVLLQRDQNPQMRAGYERFLAVIDRRKPYGVNWSVALLPSTNVNRGTTNTVYDTGLGQFVIDPASQAQSGFGVQVGANAFALRPLDGNRRLVARLESVLVAYDDADFGSFQSRLGVAFEDQFEDGALKIGPYIRQQWRKDDADSQAAGFEIEVHRNVSDDTRLSVTARKETRRFETQSYQDGGFAMAAFGVRHHLSEDLSVEGTVTWEESTPTAAHLQYGAARLSGTLTKSWASGLETSLGFELWDRDFIGNYPLSTVPRADDGGSLNVGVQHDAFQVQGFVPRVTCARLVNTSNIALFDYEASECQLSLSRRF